MDKTQFFIRTVKELCQKMKIDEPTIRQDNRLGGYIASISSCLCGECENIILRYNEKIIKHKPKWELIHVALHEIGHILTDGKDRIESEYLAEKFALEKIEEDYFQYYDRALNYTIWVADNCNSIYQKAYSKLLEEIGVIK